MKNIKKDFELFARDYGVSSLTLYDYEKIQMRNVFNPTSILQNVPMAMTPNIIEERQLNAVAMDVFSRLMMDRIIYMGMPITDQVANVINAQLLYLESVDKQKDVKMYLNSPGGSVYAGLGIFDTMQAVSPSVNTYNMGLCASMAFVLLTAGEKGKRYALKHSRSMQHQPLGGTGQAQASDIEITATQINLLKKELYEIISRNTGQDYDTVYKDCDRDYWMTAVEALDYGVIDHIVGVEPPKSSKSTKLKK
jgi:ATP-dependent Clp protease protease subunit